MQLCYPPSCIWSVNVWWNWLTMDTSKKTLQIVKFKENCWSSRYSCVGSDVGYLVSIWNTSRVSVRICQNHQEMELQKSSDNKQLASGPAFSNKTTQLHHSWCGGHACWDEQRYANPLRKPKIPTRGGQWYHHIAGYCCFTISRLGYTVKNDIDLFTMLAHLFSTMILASPIRDRAVIDIKATRPIFSLSMRFQVLTLVLSWNWKSIESSTNRYFILIP